MRVLSTNHGFYAFQVVVRQKNGETVVFRSCALSHVNKCCSTSPWGQLPVQGLITLSLVLHFQTKQRGKSASRNMETCEKHYFDSDICTLNAAVIGDLCADMIGQNDRLSDYLLDHIL